MNVLKPRNLLLPLMLVSIIAPGVSFLEPVSGGNGRWIVLAVLAAYLLSARRTIRTLSPGVVMALIGYVGWCSLTYAWSDVPSLSSMKSVALALVIFAALLGGYHWMAHHEIARGLDFLWPYAVLALMAGLGGSPGPIYESDALVLYDGATGNPNFLGSIVATSTPIILWRLYRSWTDKRVRMLWLAILAAYLVVLYLTTSRASYLIFFGVLAGLLVALGARRVALVAAASALALALFAAAAPEFSESLAQRNVYKQYGGDGEILYSREQVWEESYDGAIAGGWAGIGYGVSAGELDFGGGFTAVGYGREKGNTQLAIVEETGVVGLVLYAMLIAVMFRALLTGFWASRNGEPRVLLGLVIGTLSGMLLQSIFEAWWVAPGSPEFGFFWAMAGAGLGMARAARSGAVLRARKVKARLSPASL